ncbi:hypothetical protein ACHHYP_02799 [Achlya hypogyna]|uniref:Uncharacterized protein n=1 Tax=Achlya hypogyna TaxID=1202772 RepID=A0A1V9Z5B8_ACHHY|nr:hypothetical protein ACHHYP_02799 [Achlya hypogyna]
MDYDRHRTTDMVILEESDAKDTNAFIDEFQRRKRNRMIALLSSGVLVVGAAVAVVVLAGGDSSTSSQSSANTPTATPAASSNGLNLANYDNCGNDCMHMSGAAWAWYSEEEKLWNYDTNESKDGNWMTTGHFSNSMDPGVNQIACGYSTFPNPNIGGKPDSLVWCNYLGGTGGKIPRPLKDQATIAKEIVA